LLLCLAGSIFVGAEPPALASSLKETLTQAQQLIQKSDLAGAREVLTKATKTYPDEAAVYNLLGVVEAQAGHPGAAEKMFTKALALAPHYEGAYENLGRLYQEQAKNDPHALDKAVGLYRRLLKLNPESLEAKYQLAVIFNRKREFRASLHYLELIPAGQRDRASALSLLCADYAGIGERAKAQEAAQRLAESTDLNEADVLSVIPVLAKHGAQAVAVQLLQTLDRRGLASPNTLLQLGIIYGQEGKLTEARETLLKAAEPNPDSVPILLELARVAEKQKDFEGALSYLAHARVLEPQRAAIHFFFGVVCSEMNLIEEAYRSLRQAVTLNPENPYYNYAMGVAAEQKGQHREAVKYFRTYCELKPEDIRGKLALGTAYFYGHEPELARQELMETAKRPETAAASHYLLGRLASQEGNLTEAHQEIEQSLRLAPDFAGAYAELGYLHLKQKEYQKAEQALTKALALEPENYQATLYLTMLYARTRDPRAAAQNQAFEELKKKKAEKVKEFYRIIEVRPPSD
jgi:tetratricopeptide (TPR) repeat protein